ncbi:MAG: ATP-binding cassette domain-containing protein, partial [Nitrospinaceae bacterium]
MIVRFDKVSKYFQAGGTRITALSDVSLSLEKRDFVTVMGPSGGGKTTLLNCMGGLDQPDQGEIYLNGHSLSGMSDRELTQLRRRDIGFVFQFFNLMPTLS